MSEAEQNINVQDNYRAVRGEIDSICKSCGRNPEDVTLIAVSKTKPIEMIYDLMKIGVRDFGENYPQELKEKAETIREKGESVRFHAIGHLQTNKVKYIIDKVVMIHSVDNLHLAQTIEKECEKHGLDMDVLVEVNYAGEESKFGVKKEEAEPLIREISKLPHVHVKGLMTIAPFVENPEDNRSVFRGMRELLLDIKSEKLDNVDMRELSMGMTNDYKVAVEEGATLVRVGTAIFGARDYSK